MFPVFQNIFSVGESQLDVNGHVNNVVFVQWMQDVAIMHAEANGCTQSLYQELGISWVARSHQIDYRRSAHADDSVVAKTWLSDARRVSCRRKYIFLRNSEEGDLLAKAETEWVYIDFKTGRPRNIDPTVLSRFMLLGDSFHPND